MTAATVPVVSPNAPTDELARIVCESCWAHFRSWDAWNGITVHHDADLTWSESPIPHVFFNQVYGARFRYSAAQRRIATLVAHAERLGVPLLWRVGPDSTPGNLGLLLERGGFDYSDDGIAMAMDLSDLETTEPDARHIKIVTVRDERGMQAWTDIGIEGFGFPDFATEPVFELHCALGLDAHQPHQHYLAYVEDKAVGMATMTTYCGVVVLQNLATRQAFRWRGVGTALTRHVMREGRKRGYKTGVLQSSALGRGVYRNIGFREVGQVLEYTFDTGDKG